jgi:hypothetical protein
MQGEGIVLLGVLAGRGPGHAARNGLESFTQFVGNENFSAPLVPHQLTDDLRQMTVVKCSELLRALEDMQRTHFHHIITGDENWFYAEYQHASQ